MRSFIRHPTDIPIRIRHGTDGDSRRPLRNVSYGGICCLCDGRCEPDSAVTVIVDFVDPGFRLPGRVAWCRQINGRYEVGIEFACEETDLFTVKMVEQVCAIEAYRKKVQKTEGRTLDCEQAAREWSGRYAAAFAGEPLR